MSSEAKKNLKDDRYPVVLYGEPYYYFLEHMRSLNPKSVRVYKRRLAEFLIHHNSNTVDFYKFIVENRNPKDSRDKDVLKKLLDDYCLSLMTREVDPYMFNTVLSYVYSFNHFLEGNDQSIGYRYDPPKTLSPEEYMKKVVPNGAERILRDKVNKLMTFTTNPQYRSIMTLMKDTGLRSSDMCQIQYKHIRGALADPAPEYITFEILPIKNMHSTKLMANPVMGPDSIKHLRLWVARKKKKYAERYGYEKRLLKKAQTWKMYSQHKETLVPKEYPYTEDDEDYVYCYMETKKSYVRKDGLHIPGRSFGERLDQGAGANIIQIIKRDHKDEFKKLSANSFRKSHSTGLTAGGVPERWVNVLQGKKGEGTQGIYQRPDERELIEKYSAGYHEIALEKPESKRNQELQARLEHAEVALLKERLGLKDISDEEIRQALRTIKNA